MAEPTNPTPPTPPTPPPAEPGSPGSPSTAAAVVLDGRERELTTQIAELEDRYSTEKQLREQAEAAAAELRKQAQTPTRKKSIGEAFQDWWEGRE